MAERIVPDYAKLHPWEYYPADLPVEYRQCLEEGRDVARYEALVEAVAGLPAGAHQARLGDAVYALLMDAPQQSGYVYQEPDDLEALRALRPLV